MEKKKISELLNKLPLNNSNRQENIDTLLDSEISLAINNGTFDIYNSSFNFSPKNDSVLSTIKDSELTSYLKDKNWLININRTITFNIKLPTYMYVIDFGNKYAGKTVNFIYNNELIEVGDINEQGLIQCNLAEVLKSKLVYPTDVDRFIFRIEKINLEVNKVNSNGEYIPVETKIVNIK